jgi:hypothetical protein
MSGDRVDVRHPRVVGRGVLVERVAELADVYPGRGQRAKAAQTFGRVLVDEAEITAALTT